MATAQKKVAAAPAVAEDAPLRTVTIVGRTVAVKCPTGEQLLAHYEAIEVLKSLEVAAENLRALREAMEQFYAVLGYLMVDQADREWLAVARKTGEVSMEMPDVLGVIDRIAEVYKDQLPGANLNREQRRVAARKKA